MARVPMKRARCATTGKIRFTTESQALKQARRWDKPWMVAYKCRGCGMWHLSGVQHDVLAKQIAGRAGTVDAATARRQVRIHAPRM